MFSDLVGRGIIRCPDSGEKLEALEPWLFATAESDNLYPVISGTPVLHAENDTYLESEVWTISRALAQWPEYGEVRDWYFSRYGTLAAPELAELDTAVVGEGYPGFWNQVDLPEFVRPLVETPPEDMIASYLQGQKLELGLDLGCGQGGMLQRMSQVCERSLGLELNFYLATLANHQLAASEIPLRYLVPERGMRRDVLTKPSVNNALVLCGDVEDLPFAYRSFDWIHCGHFLDLVDEPAEVLANVCHLLKPGGWLTICTPWDFEVEGHFDRVPEVLEEYCATIDQREGVPWLRFNHKRRFVLHEDWLWVGKRR